MSATLFRTQTANSVPRPVLEFLSVTTMKTGENIVKTRKYNTGESIMKFKSLIIAGLLTSALAVQQADAAVIASYSFTGASTASTDVEPNSVAADVTTPNFLFSSSSGTAFALGNVAANSEAGAISDNDYFSFTVTPDAGFGMNLTSLDFDTAYNRGAGPNASAANAFFFLRSSLDSFASNIGVTFTHAFANGNHPTGETGRSVNLTGAAFQNLTAATTFRIYIYDEDDFITRAARIDDVELNGAEFVVPVSVPVPEPSTCVLAALGLLGLIGFGRRRKR